MRSTPRSSSSATPSSMNGALCFCPSATTKRPGSSASSADAMPAACARVVASSGEMPPIASYRSCSSVEELGSRRTAVADVRVVALDVVGARRRAVRHHENADALCGTSRHGLGGDRRVDGRARVHVLHDRGEDARVRLGEDAVAEVEDVAALRRVLAGRRRRPRARSARSPGSAAGSRLPCRAMSAPRRTEAAESGVRQSTPTTSGPAAASSSSRWPPPSANDTTGTPSGRRRSMIEVHHGQHLGLVARRRERPGPAVEELHGRGAGADLRLAATRRRGRRAARRARPTARGRRASGRACAPGPSTGRPRPGSSRR